MGAARVISGCVASLAISALVGCGSSGSATTGGSTTTARSEHAIQTPIQNRGIKGENPTAEAATRLRLSGADCRSLARLAEARLGRKLRITSDPSPPLSRCRLDGSGSQVNVFLDAGFAANQRYHNRIEETVQFNTRNPAGLPRPVPDVGEKAAYNSDASWIPALGSLLAVRGNRWLTVTIAVTGLPEKQLRDQAAALARAGFKLSAGG